MQLQKTRSTLRKNKDYQEFKLHYVLVGILHLCWWVLYHKALNQPAFFNTFGT